MFAAEIEPKRLPATFVAVTAVVIAMLRLIVPLSSTGSDFEECAERSRQIQYRSFDIAGPNPTANERTRIYSEYKRFVDLQRREAALAELQQPVAEEPRVLAMSMPIYLHRPKRPNGDACMIEGSLSCTWVKLASTVRNAFASSGSTSVAPANSR
jgi:hypothetical protein